MGDVAAPGVIQVAGYSRSGTTLLEMLLAARFGGVALGEARFVFERGILDDQRCACGQPFWSCPWWSAIAADVFGTRTAAERVARLVLDGNWLAMWSFPAVRFRPGAGGHQAYLRGVVGDLLAAAAARADGRWLIDSSKDPVWFELEMGRAERVVMVHIVRDARAVAHSNRKSVLRPEITSGQELMPRFGLLRTMRDYTIWNVGSAMASPSEGHLLLTYEDMCADPTTALDPLVPVIGRSGATTEGIADYHSVSGNPLRFKVSPADVVVTPATDEWRRELPIATRLAAQAISAPSRLAVRLLSTWRDDRLGGR